MKKWIWSHSAKCYNIESVMLLEEERNCEKIWMKYSKYFLRYISQIFLTIFLQWKTQTLNRKYIIWICSWACLNYRNQAIM